LGGQGLVGVLDVWFTVIYDIRDPKRLVRVAKAMEGYGERVQKSVFECELDRPGFARMKQGLEAIMDLDADSIKYFRICDRCWGKAEAIGQCERMTPLGDLVVL